MNRVRVADIAIDPRSGGADAIYTYRVNESAAIGEAFFVPLGNRSHLGFAVRIYDASEAELGFAFDSLRSVQAQVENLSLPAALIDLAQFVADEYLCSLPTALTAATPPGVRERLATVWILNDNAGQGEEGLFATDSKFIAEVPLNAAQREIIRSIRDAGGSVTETAAKPIPAAQRRTLKVLQAKGLVDQMLRILPYRETKKQTSLLQLNPDGQKIESYIQKEGKRKPAQVLTLMCLQAGGQSGFTPAEIKALAGVTDATIRALVEAGMLEPSAEKAVNLKAPPTPNPHQQLAIDAISSAVQDRRHEEFLLFGVTGSGKTEVYLRSVAEALKQGRQVLYLVPEIALAAQAISQLRDRFGKRVTVLHSDLTPAERLHNWLSIRSGESPIVLGARSALFAPVANLGLIIVDEEHEQSYKQESTPRYHAKRLAQFLADRHGCPLVLGSATPSVESFHEAEEREAGGEGLILLSLPERAASAKLPTVFVDDLSAGYKVGKPAILCDDLDARLRKTLDAGHQAILFLNRRAYAPFVVCRDCGHQMLCPNCSVSLSFHRREGKLRCHYCGFSTRPQDTCPACQGSRLAPFGVGTQKVEESVAAAFPDARVGRLDRDVAKRKGVLESTLAAFRSGDLNILVGTQMVAKGLDFPNVTLVGVIAADTSLNIPDFRSAERTFQLLSQVAGRAGRSLLPGEVVIQTFNPDHGAIVNAQAHDYLAFYESARRERELAGYPPYRRLVNITLSGESRAKVISAGEELVGRLASVECADPSALSSSEPASDTARPEGRTVAPLIEILGPVDCVIERVLNRWRRHVLLKLPPQTSAKIIQQALDNFSPPTVRVEIDVDPYSLM